MGPLLHQFGLCGLTNILDKSMTHILYSIEWSCLDPFYLYIYLRNSFLDDIQFLN